MNTAPEPANAGATTEDGRLSPAPATHAERASASSRWDKRNVSAHTVQFYASDDFFIEQVSEFIEEGLSAGDACLVIGTTAHCEQVEQRLKASGYDLVSARRRGFYAALDAATTMARFMVDGALNEQAFTGVIGNAISRAAYGHRRTRQPRRVRVFGEMVALLWVEGNHAGAIHLEELWNKLRESDKCPPFALFCAYSMLGFTGKAHEQAFREICASHTQVIPDERYTALADPVARLRAITLLQQQAGSLEGEATGRKDAEQRLRISEHLYRHLFEASMDGILVVDPVTRTIIEANPAVADLLGASQEDLLWQDFWQVGLFPDQERAQRLWRDLEMERYVRHETLRLPRGDGESRYIEFVSKRFWVNSHEVIQCHLRDITDRKRGEEAQRQLEARKDAFISMASHELRTPVTSLKAFTQILQLRLQRQPEMDTQALAVLERMDAQLNRQTQLISDLLDLSKIEAGVLALHEAPFDLDAMVREIVDDAQATTATHQLRVHGATHARVFGDRERLAQALVNLLTNAIKYSPQSDAVLVTLRSDQEWAEVAVRDFGIGIAPEHQQRIFERFYQVGESLWGAYPGLGIGLFIARSIIERHGGRLALASSVGAGSTFRFSLSLHRGVEGDTNSNHLSRNAGVL